MLRRCDPDGCVQQTIETGMCYERIGLEMYLDLLNTIDKYEMDDDSRLDLKARLLQVFLDNDVDASGLEDEPVAGSVYARLEQIEAERDS